MTNVFVFKYRHSVIKNKVISMGYMYIMYIMYF